MTAAAIAMRKHHRRTDTRLTSSVMGHTMPDGHTMRPTDRLAAYRQQAALRHPATQPSQAPRDPAEASQEAIMRFHPEHRSARTLDTISARHDPHGHRRHACQLLAGLPDLGRSDGWRSARRDRPNHDRSPARLSACPGRTGSTYLPSRPGKSSLITAARYLASARSAGRPSRRSSLEITCCAT